MWLPTGFDKLGDDFYVMDISFVKVFHCPECGAEILGNHCSKFRVEGPEDEAKPFKMLYQMECPDCGTVINVERNYDFDRGLIGYAFSW